MSCERDCGFFFGGGGARRGPPYPVKACAGGGLGGGAFCEGGGTCASGGAPFARLASSHMARPPAGARRRVGVALGGAARPHSAWFQPAPRDGLGRHVDDPHAHDAVFSSPRALLREDAAPAIAEDAISHLRPPAPVAARRREGTTFEVRRASGRPGLSRTLRRRSRWRRGRPGRRRRPDLGHARPVDPAPCD